MKSVWSHRGKWGIAPMIVFAILLVIVWAGGRTESKGIEVNGQRYVSIADAARELGCAVEEERTRSAGAVEYRYMISKQAHKIGTITVSVRNAEVETSMCDTVFADMAMTAEGPLFVCADENVFIHFGALMEALKKS